MKEMELFLIEKSAEYLKEQRDDPIDYALLELAAKFMVWSFLLENTSRGNVEDVGETFRQYIKGVEVETEWEEEHLLAVLSFSYELVVRAIEINGEGEEEEEDYQDDESDY